MAPQPLLRDFEQLAVGQPVNESDLFADLLECRLERQAFGVACRGRSAAVDFLAIAERGEFCDLHFVAVENFGENIFHPENGAKNAAIGCG